MKRIEHYQDGGPSVEFYDLREAGGPGTLLEGDVEFYLAQARRTGGPVLDLACGTGRVAFPLARAGFDVTGIDKAPGMIAIAREKQRAAGLKNVRFLRGNMSGFALTRRFEPRRHRLPGVAAPAEREGATGMSRAGAAASAATRTTGRPPVRPATRILHAVRAADESRPARRP
jgi:SAM-dependent methyltransferase